MFVMKKISTIYLVISSPLIVISDAHAYLDPGTGTMIIQGLIGAAAAASVAIGAYWHKIKQFFSKDELQEEGTDEDTGL
jgi:hypothetical protein